VCCGILEQFSFDLIICDSANKLDLRFRLKVNYFGSLFSED